jgi:transposase-like protein
VATSGEQRKQDQANNVRPIKRGQDQIPDPEVSTTPKARTFTREDKLRILAEADQCRHGELGALCRREGIYSWTLSHWRKQWPPT